MSKYSDSHTHMAVCGRTLDLSTPRVMGILNVTPDSFSDGGEFTSVSRAIDHIGIMVEEGADIIDIGGESTRPGSDPVATTEEIERVIPVIEKAASVFPEAILSVDTTKYDVAEKALQAGAHIVNDVSGLREGTRLAELCSSHNAGYVLMHSKGDPKTMQQNPEYDDVIGEISGFFEKKTELLRKAGVESIMIDPGIGFGKTLAHNLRIIAELGKFTTFQHPVLIGASRKSMIGQLLGNRPVGNRMAGSLAVHYHCLLKGAKILRVHDVQEAADSVRIFNAIQEAEQQAGIAP